jgi:hypothetical protein
MKKIDSEWIQTYSGLQAHPLDLQPNEICIEDIAHALSNICRFTGHCKEFYSVAQHSVNISRLCSPKNKLWGLLHDASEAYICDIASPVKHSIPFSYYRHIEKRVMGAILKKFNLPLREPGEVKKIDHEMVILEAKRLGLYSNAWGKQWGRGKLNFKYPPIRPLQPNMAEREFLNVFTSL